MASLYNPGYGADQSAQMYGQTATDEEERRRRQAAQQQSVLFNRPMVEARAEPSEVNPQSREEAGGQSSTQARNTQQQQTFAQLQAAGQARPAPPPPQQPQQPMQQMGGVMPRDQWERGRAQWLANGGAQLEAQAPQQGQMDAFRQAMGGAAGPSSPDLAARQLQAGQQSQMDAFRQAMGLGAGAPSPDLMARMQAGNQPVTDAQRQQLAGALQGLSIGGGSQNLTMQQPVGIDPVAAAADPDGYQRWLQGAQAQEAARPGSTMLASQQSERFTGPMVNAQAPQPSQQSERFTGPMVYAQAGGGGGTSVSQNPLLGGGSFNPNTGQQYGPTGQPRSGKSNVGVPAPGDMPIGGFDGDISGYLQRMLNTPGQQVNVPTAYDAASDAELQKMLRGLNGNGLPTAPESYYDATNNKELTDLMARLGGMTGPDAAPTAYNPMGDKDLMQQLEGLGGITLPTAPEYQPDGRLLAEIMSLTQSAGQMPAGVPRNPGGDQAQLFGRPPLERREEQNRPQQAAGVSAQGLNPLASARAQAPQQAQAQAFMQATEQAPRQAQAQAQAQPQPQAQAQAQQQAAAAQAAEYAPEKIAADMQSAGFQLQPKPEGGFTAVRGNQRFDFNADGSRVAPRGMVYTPGNQLVRDGTVFFGENGQPQVPHPSGRGFVPLNETTMQELAARGVTPTTQTGRRGAAVPYQQQLSTQIADLQTRMQTQEMSPETQQATQQRIAEMQQMQQLLTGGAGAPAGGAVSAQGVNPLAAAAQATMAGGPGGDGGAPVGAPAGRTSAVDDLTDQQLTEALRNPSGFDNAEVQRLYEQMGQGIDDRFRQEQTALEEQMAARGLSDSSILGGRLADLNVGRRSARTELANQLLTQRAQDLAQSRNAAIGLGMQSRNAALEAELGRGNLSLQGELGRGRLGLDTELGRGRLDLDTELGQGNLALGQQRAATEAELGRGNLALQGELGRGNLSLGQQRAAADAAQAQAQIALAQRAQTFNEEQGRAGIDLNRDRFGLERTLGLGNLDINRDQAALARTLGTGNLGIAQQRLGLDTQGQAFGQRMQGLQFQNQVGQQGFQNQMSSAELAARLAGQQFTQGLQGAQFRNQLGQQDFTNRLASSDFDLRRTGQQFNQGMQTAQFQNQLGQQTYTNQLSNTELAARLAGQQFNQNLQGAQFRNQLGQQGFTNQMSIAEMNRALGNDTYSRGMGYLDRLIGVGQDAFNNDLRREQLNMQRANDQWRQYLDTQNLYRGR